MKTRHACCWRSASSGTSHSAAGTGLPSRRGPVFFRDRNGDLAVGGAFEVADVGDSGGDVQQAVADIELLALFVFAGDVAED